MSIIMLSILVSSTAMMFTTIYTYFVEKVKENNTEYFTFHFPSERDFEDKMLSPNYKESGRTEKFQHFLNETLGVETYYKQKQMFLGDIWEPCDTNNQPINKWDVEELQRDHFPCGDEAGMRAYFEVVFADDTSRLGIRLIEGRFPTKEREIAISQANMDAILKYKRYINKRTGEIVEFLDKNDFVDKFIPQWNLTITGVTSDTKSNQIILPKKFANEYKEDPSSCFTMSIMDKNIVASNIMFDATPLTDNLKQMHFNDEFSQYNLKEDEIVICDDFLLDKFEENNIEVKVGDKITLLFGGTKRVGFFSMFDESKIIYQKTFVVKDIRTDLYNLSRKSILMNENVFHQWYGVRDLKEYSCYISSKDLSVSLLKQIEKYYKTVFFKNSGKQYQNTSVIVRADGVPVEMLLNEDFVKTFNQLSMPLFVISLLGAFAIIIVLFSDLIKEKAREILILKSFGCKNSEILKIFLCFVLAIFIIQILLSLLLGYGLLALFNWFVSLDTSMYFTFFNFNVQTILILVFTTAIVDFGAVVYNMLKINDKNLRKAFQKTKE